MVIGKPKKEILRRRAGELLCPPPADHCITYCTYTVTPLRIVLPIGGAFALVTALSFHALGTRFTLKLPTASTLPTYTFSVALEMMALVTPAGKLERSKRRNTASPGAHSKSSKWRIEHVSSRQESKSVVADLFHDVPRDETLLDWDWSAGCPSDCTVAALPPRAGTPVPRKQTHPISC